MAKRGESDRIGENAVELKMFVALGSSIVLIFRARDTVGMGNILEIAVLSARTFLTARSCRHLNSAWAIGATSRHLDRISGLLEPGLSLSATMVQNGVIQEATGFEGHPSHRSPIYEHLYIGVFPLISRGARGSLCE